MREVFISEEIVTKARDKASEMGELKNSITGGDGNIAGFIGEFLVAEMIGATVCNTYDYDLLLDGERIDVKTKRTNYPPKPHYECSIAAFNTKQKCDCYYFVRVKNDFSKAWILGSYGKEDYFKDAKFYRKGDKDQSNNFTFKADCYNLPIYDLKE